MSKLAFTCNYKNGDFMIFKLSVFVKDFGNRTCFVLMIPTLFLLRGLEMNSKTGMLSFGVITDTFLE